MNDKIDITLQRKYTDKEIILRTLKYIKPVLAKFILGLVLILINVLLNVIAPRIMGDFMSRLDAKYLSQGSFESIIFFVVCYFLIIVANMILTYILVLFLLV